VNEWVLPFAEDADFVSKFSGKSDRQHDAATMEMLLLTLLRGAGLDMQKVARGRNRTPDFLMNVEREVGIYLECTLAANALESHDERQRKESVMQYVEEIPDFPYYVSVGFNDMSAQSLSKNKLYRFLDQFRPPFGFSGLLYEVPYCAEGWDLTLTLMPKSDDSQPRTRGITSQGAKIVDNYKTLYSALKGKRASNYDLGDFPYIIAVGVDDMTANEPEFYRVLFGRQLGWDVRMEKGLDGFFLGGDGPVNTFVSGVLFCKSIKLFGLTSLDMSLWHNPFAKYPIGSELPVRHVRYVEREGRYVREVQGISRGAFDLLGKDEGAYVEFMHMKYRLPPGNSWE
jgi:hypothetical protein